MNATSSVSPRITVVLPCFNHAAYVGAAVESVLGQTVADWELIAIDDASKDDSVAVLERYQDPRIRVLRHEANRGAHATINEGLGLARGAFVAILNSDDVFAPMRFERLLAAATTTGADVLGTDVTLVDANGDEIADPSHRWHVWTGKLKAHLAAEGRIGRTLLKGNLFVTTSNFFVRRSAFDRIGGFEDLRFVHDYEWLLRALSRGLDVRYLAGEPLLSYRLHTSNTIDESVRDANAEAVGILLRHAGIVRREGVLVAGPEWARQVRACSQTVARTYLKSRSRPTQRAGTDTLHAHGFSPWKRVFLPAFLGSPPNRLAFGPWVSPFPPKTPTTNERLVVWGVKHDAAIAKMPVDAQARVLRMEDGFLRSVGLGSDSHAPLSLVVDSRGVYFDPTRPSDLEHELVTGTFDEAELARARALRETIVALNVSKYNVGTMRKLELPDAARGRTVVLVIGQVEDDASIRLGCVDVRTNAALLRAAREARPGAFVIYKPHPDVTSGNRQGAIPDEELRRDADLVVTDVALGACLASVDEVHTLTSLVGFEALLRGLRVVVYGQPFYAGWGLTEDRHPHPRRTVKRSLDELVAATLLRYPRYVHPETGAFTTPEAIVEHLVEARAHAQPPGRFDHSFAVKQGRKLVYIASGGRRGR